LRSASITDPHVHADPNTDGDSDRDSYPSAHSRAYGYPHLDRDSKSDGNSVSYTFGNAASTNNEKPDSDPQSVDWVGGGHADTAHHFKWRACSNRIPIGAGG